MTWNEMAIDMMKAAKATLATHPRCSASRSYYAAHAALAKTLLARGFVPAKGATTPRHKEQARLIEGYLGDLGRKTQRDLKRAVTRLYRRRLDSDYVPHLSVDRKIALESVRDAGAVFMALNMPEVL